MIYTLADMGHLGALPAHYGEDTEGSASAGGTLPPEVTQAAEVIAAATGGRANTPEELRARIVNLEGMARKVPLLSTFYLNKARRLRGRLAAMEREERETASWRSLGQTGVGVGILVGFGVLGLLIATASRKADDRAYRGQVRARLARNPEKRRTPWWLVGLVTVGGGAVLAIPDPVPASGLAAVAVMGATWWSKLSEYGVSRQNPARSNLFVRNPRRRPRRRSRNRR